MLAFASLQTILTWGSSGQVKGVYTIIPGETIKKITEKYIAKKSAEELKWHTKNTSNIKKVNKGETEQQKDIKTNSKKADMKSTISIMTFSRNCLKLSSKGRNDELDKKSKIQEDTYGLKGKGWEKYISSIVTTRWCLY